MGCCTSISNDSESIALLKHECINLEDMDSDVYMFLRIPSCPRECWAEELRKVLEWTKRSNSISVIDSVMGSCDVFAQVLVKLLRKSENGSDEQEMAVLVAEQVALHGCCIEVSEFHNRLENRKFGETIGSEILKIINDEQRKISKRVRARSACAFCYSMNKMLTDKEAEEVMKVIEPEIQMEMKGIETEVGLNRLLFAVRCLSKSMHFRGERKNLQNTRMMEMMEGLIQKHNQNKKGKEGRKLSAPAQIFALETLGELFAWEGKALEQFQKKLDVLGLITEILSSEESLQDAEDEFGAFVGGEENMNKESSSSMLTTASAATTTSAVSLGEREMTEKRGSEEKEERKGLQGQRREKEIAMKQTSTQHLCAQFSLRLLCTMIGGNEGMANAVAENERLMESILRIGSEAMKRGDESEKWDGNRRGVLFRTVSVFHCCIECGDAKCVLDTVRQKWFWFVVDEFVRMGDEGELVLMEASNCIRLLVERAIQNVRREQKTREDEANKEFNRKGWKLVWTIAKEQLEESGAEDACIAQLHNCLKGVEFCFSETLPWLYLL